MPLDIRSVLSIVPKSTPWIAPDLAAQVTADENTSVRFGARLNAADLAVGIFGIRGKATWSNRAGRSQFDPFGSR
jgi:hypothetical protein